jgi:hypothetical protein
MKQLISFFLLNIKSIFRGKWTKERFINAFVLFKAREGRGSGWFAWLWDLASKGSVVAVFTIVLGVKIPWYLYIWLSLIYGGMSYLIGQWDEYKGGFWMKENEISNLRYNPVNRDIIARLERIEKICQKKQKNR